MKKYQSKLRRELGAFLFCAGILSGALAVLAADNAQLISVSIPSNSVITPGTIFTQIWTLQNTGTTTWKPGTSGYTLKMVGMDSLGAIPFFANAEGTPKPSAIVGSGQSVAPGAQATFSLMFIAPLGGGSYIDTFQMNDKTNFGPLVTMQIDVPNGTSTNQFDRSRTISYANNYAPYVVRDGYFWNNGSSYSFYGTNFAPVPTNFLGDDCAHFVSSCIGQSPKLWGGGLYIPTRVPPTYGEPGAGRLVNTCLIGAGYAFEVSSLSEMSPGDVVGWNWEGDPDINNLDHVTLYLGNGLLASHAISALDVSADTYFQDGAPYAVRHLVHIGSVSATLLTPQMNTNGLFTFSVSCNLGGMFQIQSSTDLANWTTLGSISNSTGSFQVYANQGSHPPTATFYRALRMAQ